MRHDADELRESLTVDNIETLLFELGATRVTEHTDGKENLRANTICHNEYGGSHKLYYYDESKIFCCYTGCSESFNVFSLVERVYQQKNIDMHFSNIVDYVARKTGRSFGFGSSVERSIARNEEMEWLNRFTRREIEYPPLETYSDRILDVFSPHLGHPEFTEDGISVEAMDTFDIRYYNTENAIVIPHRNIDGDIVGVMQRNLDKHAIANGAKYMPSRVQEKLLSFSKHQNLFGLNHNLANIRRLGKVAIFESEKSVLQVESMYGRENNFSVALGGKNISQYQVDLLLDAANVREVIFCFDKEFEHHEDKQAKAFEKVLLDRARRFSLFVQTYIVWDKEGLLERNMSPSDMGAEVLERLMLKKIEVLNKDEDSVL